MTSEFKREALTEVAKTDGRAAQLLFESLFPDGHTPKVDTRTPAEVAAGLTPAEAKEMRR